MYKSNTRPHSIKIDAFHCICWLLIIHIIIVHVWFAAWHGMFSYFLHYSVYSLFWCLRWTVVEGWETVSRWIYTSTRCVLLFILFPIFLLLLLVVLFRLQFGFSRVTFTMFAQLASIYQMFLAFRLCGWNTCNGIYARLKMMNFDVPTTSFILMLMFCLSPNHSKPTAKQPR